MTPSAIRRILSPSVSSTAPVRIRLRYASFDAFIDKFAPNVTRGGVFIASRTPLPIGTTFAFEIQLAGGEVALAGDGKVTWVKPFDPAAPQKPHGMGVQFLRLDTPSRELLNKILARKAARGRFGRGARAPMPAVGIGRSPARHQRHGVAPEGRHQRRPGRGVRRRRGAAAARRRSQLAGRQPGELDELEKLLQPEPVEPVSIAQALAELPRLLADGGRPRRMSGAVRALGSDKPDDPR